MTDHLQQAAAGVVILLMGLQMFGQIVDPLGENRDLYLRGTMSPSWVAYSRIMAVFSSGSIFDTSFSNFRKPRAGKEVSP